MRCKRENNRRSGTAVVELAICLPIILVLILGSIEICNMIFLKQAVTAAAYEGALSAIRPGTSDADVDQAINATLNARNISGGDPTYDTPEDKAIIDLNPGDLITIELRVPAANNIPRPRILSNSRFITARVSGIKQ